MFFKVINIIGLISVFVVVACGNESSGGGIFAKSDAPVLNDAPVNRRPNPEFEELVRDWTAASGKIHVGSFVGFGAERVDQMIRIDPANAKLLHYATYASDGHGTSCHFIATVDLSGAAETPRSTSKSYSGAKLSFETPPDGAPCDLIARTDGPLTIGQGGRISEGQTCDYVLLNWATTDGKPETGYLSRVIDVSTCTL